jgi:tetratricopeptide (TPR) repeat protein
MMTKRILMSIIALLLVSFAVPVESRAAEEGFFYSGQVASYKSRMDAAASVKALKARGQTAFYEKVQVKGKGLYFRVYVGKYESRAEAMRELGRLKEDKVIGSFLVHRKGGVLPKQKRVKVTAKAVPDRPETPVPDETRKKKTEETDTSYLDERRDRDAEYYYIVGIAFDAKGKHENALNCYTRALEKDPKFAAAYNKRGVIYLLMGNSDLAIADHKRAIDIDPNNGEFRFNRGLDYRLAGQYNPAISDFQTACRMGIDQACDALRRLEEKIGKSKAETKDRNETKDKVETETGK